MEDVIIASGKLNSANCMVYTMQCGECGSVYLRFEYPESADDHGICDCQMGGCSNG
jgi:hypothetical protein